MCRILWISLTHSIFYLLFLSLTLFTSLHLIRFIVLPFIKCKRDQKCHRQRKKTDLSMKRNGNSNSCFHFNRQTFLHAHRKYISNASTILITVNCKFLSAIVSIYIFEWCISQFPKRGMTKTKLSDENCQCRAAE